MPVIRKLPDPSILCMKNNRMVCFYVLLHRCPEGFEIDIVGTDRSDTTCGKDFVG